MALLSQLFTALLLLHFGLHLLGGSEAAGESGEPGASHGELINSLQEELKNLTARFSLMEKAASYSAFVKVGQKFYVSDGLSKTFHHGVKFCSDAGGKLPLPRNLEENQKIFGVLQVFGFPFVFIGANDHKTEGDFVDLEGNALDFFRWHTGEPNSFEGNEDCVAIDKNAHWHDIRCEHSLLIVCEIS